MVFKIEINNYPVKTTYLWHLTAFIGLHILYQIYSDEAHPYKNQFHRAIP